MFVIVDIWRGIVQLVVRHRLPSAGVIICITFNLIVLVLRFVALASDGRHTELEMMTYVLRKV